MRQRNTTNIWIYAKSILSFQKNCYQSCFTFYNYINLKLSMQGWRWPSVVRELMIGYGYECKQDNRWPQDIKTFLIKWGGGGAHLLVIRYLSLISLDKNICTYTVRTIWVRIEYKSLWYSYEGIGSNSKWGKILFQNRWWTHIISYDIPWIYTVF